MVVLLFLGIIFSFLGRRVDSAAGYLIWGLFAREIQKNAAAGPFLEKKFSRA
jgi:hypothetical protein